MKKVYTYLREGVTEAFIPFEENDVSTTCSKSVKAYCFSFGVKAETETIYGCDKKGKGYRFLHVILDKPIERKKEWK